MTERRTQSEFGIQADETEEFEAMWNGLCWEAHVDSLRAVPCTEPKGHKGPHVCTFATLDRYHELRLRLQERES